MNFLAKIATLATDRDVLEKNRSVLEHKARDLYLAAHGMLAQLKEVPKKTHEHEAFFDIIEDAIVALSDILDDCGFKDAGKLVMDSATSLHKQRSDM